MPAELVVSARNSSRSRSKNRSRSFGRLREVEVEGMSSSTLYSLQLPAQFNIIYLIVAASI